MFHIHVMGCISFLEGYGSSKANRVMGKWFDKLQKFIGEQNLITQIGIILLITFFVVAILMALGT